jgi:putative transposase
LCALVIVGVRADGTKELVAVTAGTRESTQDWESLLGDLRRRGMRAPVVMVGDGALGLWAALRQVFPPTRERAMEAFAAEFGIKWPKAVAKVTDDADSLLTFYDYPAEHWLHLRTTNPIESTFAPVRARTKVTKGPGNAAAGLAMVFKLLEAAEQRWRKVNGPRLVALVRAGALFEGGKLVERPEGEVNSEASDGQVAA